MQTQLFKTSSKNVFIFYTYLFIVSAIFNEMNNKSFKTTIVNNQKVESF